MRTIPLLAAATAVVAALPAQSSFVVPPSATSQIGGSRAGFPFSYTDYVLYQQAIGTSNFSGGAVLFGMALRVQTPATLQSVPEAATQGLRVTLADSTNPPSALSATYAANRGANATVVFDGVVTVQKTNPHDPLEFNVAIPFTTPYVHTNAAPLLVELFPTSYQGQTCNGGGNGTSFDGANDPSFGTVVGKGPCGTGPTTGSPQSGAGFVIEFFTDASAIPYGRGCPGSNGQVPQIGSSGGGAVLGNSSFLITLSGAAPGVNMGAFLLGSSNLQFGAQTLPVDLGPAGMPDCYLHQDLAVTIGYPVSGGGTLFPLGIPNSASLSGQSVFPQWALLDASANAAGVVTTQGAWVLVR